MTGVVRLSALALALAAFGCGGRTLGESGSTGDPEPRLTQNLSGTYALATLGSRVPCTVPNAPLVTQSLPGSIQLVVQQDLADLSRGTVVFDGTGEIMLDTRAFNATFSGDSFSVEVHGPLSPTCNQNYSISVAYDFSGDGARLLDLQFESKPECRGNGGSYCIGSLASTFGDAKPAAGLK
jgi:hypothetical protein